MLYGCTFRIKRKHIQTIAKHLQIHVLSYKRFKIASLAILPMSWYKIDLLRMFICTLQVVIHVLLFFVWCWLSFMRTCWVKNQELCHSMKFRAFVVQGFINVCFCVFSVFSWRNGALCLFYGLRNLDRRMLTLSCVFFFCLNSGMRP